MNGMKRVFCVLIALLMLSSAIPVFAAGGEKEVRILFTHDIHSYFVNTSSMIDGKVREHGGAARLKTLVDRYSNDSSVYVDAGDFSMGTLIQTGFATDAYELRLLGELGCKATTLGNHEFDFGDDKLADMLRSAMRSGDKLPMLIQSNMVTDGDLTENQKILADAMKEYGAKKYTVIDVNGVKIAFFGVFGIDSLDCTPTTEMVFENYIEYAKKTVDEIKKNEECDLIVCLSHAGTSGDGKNGEDFDLAKKVPDIDVIISGHSHTRYQTPVLTGQTVIVCCGEYLSFLGKLDITVRDGKAEVKDYELIPCDENVEEDPVIAEKTESFKQKISETYLSEYIHGDSAESEDDKNPDEVFPILTGTDSPDVNNIFDEVICHSDFDFMPLDEMYETHMEYPFGNLIADSYIYEAKKNGIDDIDVALVGLGTIRGSFSEGDITTSDAFEICSLGVGSDGSAGHPIIVAYLTGKELKMIAELDASAGPMISSIKMSYSGLSYTFNTKRMILNKVTDIGLVRADGTKEKIEDKKLYKAACNLYAVNMLGMLNDLTYGMLKIVPKDAEGNVVDDLYDFAMKDADGNEVKEWVAFRNYLSSFPEKNGIPTIPDSYREQSGRKNKIEKGGFAVIEKPGFITCVVIALPIVLIALVVLLIATRKKRKARRQKRKAEKINRKQKIQTGQE